MQPRVLGVIAHPDDETVFAATAYRLVHQLGGALDLAVVTNGEAGFRYAGLAAPLYGAALTEEAVGRARLPAIRREELRQAGRILGVRAYHFLDLVDTGNTRDPAPFFDGLWDVDGLRRRLTAILEAGGYDFAFTMLPVAESHAHHQVAGVVAVEAAAALPAARRPVVLGCLEYGEGGRPHFPGSPGRPLLDVHDDAPVLELDRRARLGPGGALDLHVVVSWAVAAHLTQGKAQMRMRGADLEGFWCYAMNGEAGAARAAALFTRLGRLP
jgi:LmbE family N-acetylglucosaminyl deacetylase